MKGNIMEKVLCLYILLLCGGMCMSCGEDFLNVKSDMSIAAPGKISDYQALLDNTTALMNITAANSFALIAGEEYRVETTVWQNLPVTNNRKQHRNAYLWLDEIYEGEPGQDWNLAYQRILHANIVLDGLSRLKPSVKDQAAWNHTQGSALFFRAWSYHILAQTFCRPYRREDAARDPGVPLRRDSDPTASPGRSTVKELYDFIVDDLTRAAGLLEGLPQYKMRPSKLAALGLLARVYMQMDDYGSAFAAIGEALDLDDSLIDYNGLDGSKSYAFTYDYGQSNPEVVFYEEAHNHTIMNSTRLNVNTDLLDLYAPGDLRRDIFYRTGSGGNIYFRGGYHGRGGNFTGLTLSEYVLVHAECAARLERWEVARSDLRYLAVHRFEEGTSPDTDGIENRDLLAYILEERRREMAFRGVRWEDLRRLNKDALTAHTLIRTVDGKDYVLLPNSPKYVWPIPPEVIGFNGYQQNER
ncbi:RagB/SusD family nutrient uptake outer membrane protein [Sphingobacterium sp. SGG-5]|uniref:RagB/SusD family nutrient uptake outer membrane protein n=1 Tax=Sphingobacterium sp. SGG-5 TaxID=2710881 RepID=UPI00293BE56C|nr:RagB/SusD family nutrient uptake outer membrane protein [Sphingobacterium sp. SGG-5]